MSLGGVLENGVVKMRTSALNGFTGRKLTIDILDIEIDQCCSNSRPACCAADEREIALLKYNDAPDFLHGNPFIVHGYRGTLPFTLCLRSLFVWSNDTINIWSHLLGFVAFLFLLVWDNVIVIPETHGDFVDHLVMSIGLICFQFCMLCSTGYHLFRCHSERANMRWLALDLTGISVGLLGCYLPGIHFGFYCLSVWRDIYLLVIGLLFAAVFYWQIKPRYYSARWFRARLLLYIGLTAYGVVPALHWVYLNGGLESSLVQMAPLQMLYSVALSYIIKLFAPKIVVVYLLAMLAFGFYISQFPERCYPGKFDYVGSSHQCWHVIVVGIFLWWHKSGQQLLAYRVTHPCLA